MFHRIGYDPNAPLRFLLFFIRTHTGRIFAGALLIIIGLVYGISSHTVTYQQNAQNNYIIRAVDESTGTYYLQLQGSSTFYILKDVNFTPFPSADNLGEGGHITSLMYKSDEENISISTTTGEHLSGSGHQVLQFNTTNAGGSTTFVSDELKAHPHSYYDNHWMAGGIMLGIGLLLLLISIGVFISDKRQTAKALGEGPREATSMPSPF